MTSTSLNGFTTSVSSTTSLIEGLSLTEEKPSSASFDPLGDTADALDVHISNQKEQKLVPFYDTRHLASPKTVGEVLKRPETRESRKKAHRALEVVAYTERRRLAHTPVSEQN
jgi:C1A family cysteine protease